MREALREVGISSKADSSMTSRRREFCHFDDTPRLSLLKHLTKVQGGCHQMTELSPMARHDQHAGGAEGPLQGDDDD